MMNPLELHLLGKPEVTRDGEVVDGFRSNKVRALLFYVAARGRTEARAKLAGLLWGEWPEARAKANLRKSLTNLRKIAGAHLVITRDSVGIDEDNPPWVDVVQFERGLEEADPAALAEALALYRGDFLEGFYVREGGAFEQWQLRERYRLRERLLAGLRRLAEYEAGQRAHDRAIRHVQRLLALEPLSEDMQRLLIRLYVEDGRPAQALKQYERYKKLLEEELGISPAAETAQLVARIRAGEFEARRRGGDGGAAREYVAAPPAFLEEGRGATARARRFFIGRERELAQLDEWLDEALAGRLRVGFVTGEAGMGKSALLAEFAERALARHPGLIAAAGRCNALSGQGDPFHPFREIMALLTGDVERRWRAGAITDTQARRLWRVAPVTASALVREGGGLLAQVIAGAALLERAGAWTGGNEPWLERLRQMVEGGEGAGRGGERLLAQFVAVLESVAQQRPLLLMVDDLQWADSASLDLLFHLSRQRSRQPVLVLGAYRPSDARPGSGANAKQLLPALVRELSRRFGPVEVDLAQLSEGAARAFVDKLIDSEANRLGEAFRTTFFERTQGHPLFAIELLREMQARGDLSRDAAGAWEARPGLRWELLPTRVDAVISQRLARLAPPLREILRVASVEGERFTVQAVAQVLARDERTLSGQLRRLQRQHRLVREVGEERVEGRWLTGYRFDHILFQQYLYEGLSQGERRLLHGRVAEALEGLYGGEREGALAALAHHFAEAGRGEKATRYLLAAGDRARLQNAYREALAHYERALALLREQGEQEAVARTLMKIGLTQHNASAFEQARLANEEAFRLWQQLETGQRAGMVAPTPHALRVAGERFSGALDPAMVKETPRALLVQQLFSGLMRLGHDLELLPDIASGWDVLEDGRRYLFHLRDDARWSDGQPVTAGDFEYAWKRVLARGSGSPNAPNLFDVKGARAFHRGEAEAEAVGVRAVDGTTLEVVLAQRAPYFPNILFTDATKPVPRHVVEKYGRSWTSPEKIVTNGPFRLAGLEPGTEVRLERYEGYHGPFPGNVDAVEIHLGLGEDRLRHLEMYLADRLDILYTFSHLPPDTQRRVRDELIDEYRSGPLLATWLVGFVLLRPPFDDRRVRRAFALATDRETLANVVNWGMVSPASGGFLSPAHATFTEGMALPYDPEEARRLLAAAGYPGGRGLPAIRMVNGHASLSVEANLRYLQRQWAEVLGVRLTWETVWEMGAFLGRLRADPPHLFFIRWAGQHPDPDDFLHVESALVWEWARWEDAAYFALVEEARRLADWGERMALYRRADEMLIEEAVVLPLAYDRSHLLVKPWVRRLAIPAVPRWFLREVYLAPH